MMLPFWCILGLLASWLFGAEIATGLMVLHRLARCHTIRFARPPLDLPWPRWLYRWVSSYLLAVAASPKGCYFVRDSGWRTATLIAQREILGHHGVVQSSGASLRLRSR
jgi:hypothetical protein